MAGALFGTPLEGVKNAALTGTGPLAPDTAVKPMGANVETSIVVGVGDGRIAKTPAEYLVTFALGSCIAVVCYDWRLKLGGLIHVMLPDSSIDREKAARNPFIFADTGVPALYEQLCKAGSSKRSMKFCLAGGARMLERSAHFEIGKKNHLAVKRSFWQLGLFVEAEDVGGSESRSIRLDLKTGQVDLRTGADKNRILMNPVRG